MLGYIETTELSIKQIGTINSMLINEGVEALFIKKQLGHKDIRITLNTYGHLYDNRGNEIAAMLQKKHRDENLDK